MYACFCPWCMSPVPEGGLCPVCGRAAGDYVPVFYHLPPGTILAGCYLLGRVLDEENLQLRYLSRDLRRDKLVVVVEFFSKILAHRGLDGDGDAPTFYNQKKEKLYYELELKFLSQVLEAARIGNPPGAVGIRDLFPANNAAYYVTDYEGMPLSAYVKERGGRIPPEELFPMAEPLYGVLTALHWAGRYRAEFSPDKIMVENGKLRIPTFCWDMTEQKVEDKLGGSSGPFTPPRFFPLERIQGTKRLGPWTDVYGLAVLMTYCLNGSLLHNALERFYENDETPNYDFWPGVALTPRQRENLSKALNLFPRDRFQSMEEMYTALYGTPSRETERKC